MLTIDKLKEFGADTAEGLSRCMNNEEFYIKMINLGLSDERFDSIAEILENGSLDAAFESAHALKGVFGNLALTPIYEPISELTELLRAKKEGDYMGLYNKAKAERDKLLALCK